MTEPATRNFMSQWSYDRYQDREDPRDETMQWLSVDRVAEQTRQREEHHVENDFDMMDFETRAAALEAHFFQTTERDGLSARRKSLTPEVRTRPQSASLVRRAPATNATSNPSNRFAPRPRPQSAKTRSEMTYATQTQNEVAWKSHIQQNPSKWREMLARAPEFKQLTLRRLELETYELLYNTLQQQKVVEAKPTTRRRKRRINDNGANKPVGQSPTLACGSGLHLARSRKKRQQEHDRRMMLGKDRYSSRTSELDETKNAREDKQAIQDKTSRRSKLVNQASKHENQRDAPSFQRQSSARAPWVPSGSESSLAIRGISPETSEAHLTQEKCIAQVLEAFQNHAASHVRLPKQVQGQLKRIHQSTKIAKVNEPRRIEQVIKRSPESKPHLKRARPGSAVKLSSGRKISDSTPIPQGNQEKHLANHVKFRGSTATVPVLNLLHSASEGELLFTATPRTPKLIVPPLKLPPNLWEYQLTNDTLDGLSDTPSHDQTSSTLGYTEAHSEVPPAADFNSPVAKNSRNNLSTDEFVESKSRSSPIEGISGVHPNELGNGEYDYSEQTVMSARRRESTGLEEGYLTEGLAEQANIGLSTEDADLLPFELPQESQGKVIPLIPLGDSSRVTNELAGPGNSDAFDLESNSAVHTPSHLEGGDLTVITLEGVRSTVALLTLEFAVNPTKESEAQLTAEVFPFAQKAASTDTRCEVVSDLDIGEIVQNVESISENVEQHEHQGPGGRPSSKLIAVDLVGCQENMASLAAIAHPGTHDFHLISQDSSKAVREENVGSGPIVTNGIEVAILSASNFDDPAESQERIEHRHRDCDHNICVTSTEKLHVRKFANPESTSQHENAPSKSDSKNTNVDLSGSRAKLPDANEVAPARTSRATDAIAAGETLRELFSEVMLHDQRNENLETGSDHSTPSLPPTLDADKTVDAAVNQPACSTSMAPSSTVMNDTNTEKATKASDETVAKAVHVPSYEEPMQGMLTLQADVPASPTNDRPDLLHVQQSTETGNTTREVTSESMQNQVRADPETNIHVTKEATSPGNEEPTQMKLTLRADVIISPTNDTGELLQHSTDTRNTSRETDQNQVLADPESNIHTTSTANSPGTKSEPRSPKRKVKKGGKTATPKKTKATVYVNEGLSSRASTAEVASAARIPAQVNFPEGHDRISGLAEEDPLLLHQQQVTRSFLKRVSSRKLLESESASFRPSSCREQVEHEGQLESTELESAMAKAKVVMDVETQLDREDNDRNPTSPLERESSQTLNCESTIEMYSATTEEPVPTLPTGLTFESAMTVIDANERQEVSDNTNDLASGDHETLAQELSDSTTIDNLTPQTNPDADEVVDKDSMLPPTEHHISARKIQAQYRCFVRRRLILDQLRFMLAKEHRQAKRKKAKKVKSVDTMASESESPATTVAVVVDAYIVDGVQDEVQQVGPGSVSSEIGAKMSPKALPSEEAEPPKGGAVLGARKGSCEYAFDLFDGSIDTSGEMIQEVSAWVMENSKDKVLVETPPALSGTSADTTRAEFLESEDMAPQQQALLLSSSKTASHEPLAIPAAGSPLTSMVLAEVAFSAEKLTGTVLVEANVTSDVAEVHPHWERYVDSTTSKSFYYNPATNETQWTAPSGQDHAATLSPSHMVAAATTDTPTNGQSKEWQEFLDDASGQMFYYNSKTGESSWEPPAALGDVSAEVVALPQSDATAESAASVWVMYIDPASHVPYYVNVETLATSWERPADFAAPKSTAAGEDTYMIAV